MRISVLGLGYVGTVTAGCLAQQGHDVIGVDPEPNKVNLINAGQSPIIEKDIGKIIEKQVAAGRLAASIEATSSLTSRQALLVEFVRLTDEARRDLHAALRCRRRRRRRRSVARIPSRAAATLTSQSTGS